jgi:hypothetical protein
MRKEHANNVARGACGAKVVPLKSGIVPTRNCYNILFCSSKAGSSRLEIVIIFYFVVIVLNFLEGRNQN